MLLAKFAKIRCTQKISVLQYLFAMKYVKKTVQDRTKVTIEH